MAIKINGNTVIADNQNITSTGTISATGNITSAGNIVTTGTIVGNVQTTGPVSTTGNITAGNVSATGNITASFFIGNGSQLTGIDATQIQSGTSNVKVVSSGGNVTASVGGTPNVVVIASSGTVTTGTASVSGNITGGNIAATNHTGTNVSVTGTVTAASTVGGVITGTSTSVSGGVTAASVAGGVITGTSTSVTGTQTAASTVGGVITGTSASVSGGVTAASVAGGVITGTSTSVTGAVTGASISTAGTVSATGNITGGNLLINGSTQITGNLIVQGTETIFNVGNLTVNDKDIIVANNVTGGANINGAGIQAGNPATATWFFNNATTSWQSNVSITPSANTTLNLGGVSNYWATVFATAASVSGNITGGNVLGGANVNATTHTGATVSVTGAITAGSDLSLVGNIVDTGALSIITTSNGNISLLPNGSGNINTGANIMPTANATANIGSASLSYNTIFAKATSAQYADLAEKYAADADYAPGTVVSFGGSQEVTLCVNDACSRVAGVVSTNPSYRMNDGLQSEHTAMVALTGRVPTRVTGTVCKGDMMVSAGNGVARAEANPTIGTVIGKALADSEGDAVIEVVVGRY